MAGSWSLALLSAATLAALSLPNVAQSLSLAPPCSHFQQEQLQQSSQSLVPWTDPCFTSSCPRFLYARCEVHQCMARFFVGSTDVTDHCEVDNCVVENGPDIECNGLCDIDPIAGTYCNPSCDFNNGGCSDDEVCVPDRIFCIRAPCPQPVRCIPRIGLCNQEPDTDSCGISERAFFYNAGTQRCERFIYGGCERTHNRFSTRRECRRTCRGVQDVCFGTIRCPPGTRCKSDERGQPFCEASCEYENGGCEEDEICRMRSVQCITFPCPEFAECLSRKEVCSQEADVGQCRGAFPRYFHNNRTGLCELFSYGGCGGNENRFLTLEECRETCHARENPCNLIDCTPDTTCIVNDSGEGECVSPDSCLIMPCPPRYRCERIPSTGVAECVPELITIDPCEFGNCDPCRFDICGPGTRCVVNDVTGEAECVFILDRCATVDCEEGLRCRVNELTNQPECVRPIQCAQILCLAPAFCRVDSNTGDAYCGTDPCESVVCEGGLECQYNRDRDIGECVTIDRCATVRCDEGQRCRVNVLTNEPECVAEVDQCALILCLAPAFCRIDSNTGDAYCGIDPCESVVCEGGLECQYNRDRDIGECVTIDRCATVRCDEGQRCRVNVLTNEPECVAEVDQCAVILCLAPSICRINQLTREGYCGIDPCETYICEGGFECRFNRKLDTAECVPVDPCLPTTCGRGFRCEVDPTGSPVCIPAIHPCATVFCNEPDICRVNPQTGFGYCGENPCNTVRCSRNYECRYDEESDMAECVPTAPCLLKDCPTGQICKLNTDGEGVCAPPDLRCMIFQCPPGTVCQVRKGVMSTAECVPDHPCARLDCGDQICRIDPTSGTGYCGENPCIYVRCYNCQYNPETDQAQCGVLDPCASTLCSDGTVCRVDEDSGRPECVDPCEDMICGIHMCRINSETGAGYCGLDPCTYTRCSEGTQCRYNRQLDVAECVAVDPCVTFECVEGTRCRVNPDTGHPECILVPPDVRCFLLQCAAGFVCRANNDGTVECVPEDPCEARDCGELICRVELGTGNPYCGIDPCIHTTCETGSICEYSSKLDMAICVAPSPDPCDNLGCLPGSVCKVTTDGEASCVSIDPCSGIFCSGGDICRINPTTRETFCGITTCAFTTCPANTRCEHNRETDSANCIPIDNSRCDNVQCSPETRCVVNERSVAECVSLCERVLCGRPLVCRVNTTTRETYCGDWPCRNFDCPDPNTSCQYDWETDEPFCGPGFTGIPDVCDPNPCPLDHRCVRNSRGNAECLALTIG